MVWVAKREGRRVLVLRIELNECSVDKLFCFHWLMEAHKPLVVIGENSVPRGSSEEYLGLLHRSGCLSDCCLLMCGIPNFCSDPEVLKADRVPVGKGRKKSGESTSREG